jgi:hypothetical protein
MSNPRSSRLSSGSITSEHFRDTRARAWAFVFDCYRKKEATRPGGPNDGTKSFKGNSAYEHII